nr:MAG: putative capsid protein [Picobirnavirus sp.]
MEKTSKDNNVKEKSNISKRVPKTRGGKPNQSKAKAPWMNEGHGKPSAAWSESQAITDAINDPEWYATIPELMVSSAAVNFYNPVGGPTNFERGFDAEMLRSIPGVCVLRYAPVMGVSTDNSSPINLAARNLYTFIHSVMAVGSSSYDPADYMLYTIAMASAYSYLAWMRRLYGTINLYTQLNKYLPDALLAGMGVDGPSMRDKMNQLYSYICVYQNKLGSFAIPTSLSYFTRQMWMCSGMYLDAPTNKAQIYMFNPEFFWRYEEYEGAGKLVRLPFSVAGLESICTYGDTLLASLCASQDIYTMSGDTLHAFGDNGIFKMDALDPGYLVQPFYVPEVLTQIHNATVFDGTDRDFSEITQDTGTGLNGGAIICRPIMSGTLNKINSSLFLNGTRMLSMPMDSPNPADIMVATRLMAFGYVMQDNDWKIYIDACGTEIITSMTIFRMDLEDPEDPHSAWVMDSTVIGGYAGIVINTTDVEQLAAAAQTWISYQNLISPFEHHPFIGYWNIYPAKPYLKGYSFDIDNYTVVDRAMVARMNECALMSMLKVPIMGIFDKKTT